MTMTEMINKMDVAKSVLSTRNEITAKEYKALCKENKNLPSLEWLRANNILTLARQESFEMSYKNGEASIDRVIMNDSNEVICELKDYFTDYYCITPTTRTACAIYVDIACNGGRPCHIGEVETNTFTAHRNFYAFDEKGYSKTRKWYLNVAKQNVETLQENIKKTTKKLERMKNNLELLKALA